MTKNIIVIVDGIPYRLEPATGLSGSKTPLRGAQLSVRTENALMRIGIEHLEEVLSISESDLLQKGMRRKCLSELREVIGQHWPYLQIGSLKEK